MPGNWQPERCARRDPAQADIYTGMFPKISTKFSMKEATNVSAHGFCCLVSSIFFGRLHHSLVTFTSSAARGCRASGACKGERLNPTMRCQRRQGGSGGPTSELVTVFRSNGGMQPDVYYVLSTFVDQCQIIHDPGTLIDRADLRKRTWKHR